MLCELVSRSKIDWTFNRLDREINLHVSRVDVIFIFITRYIVEVLYTHYQEGRGVFALYVKSRNLCKVSVGYPSPPVHPRAHN